MRRLFPALLVFLAIAASNTRAEVIHVDWMATGSATGASWQDAYTDLQVALSRAGAGDELWIAAGRYCPSASGDRTASFRLKSGVEIYGGFAGGEIGRTRDPQTDPTYLSGDLDGAKDYEGNSFHVVDASGVDETALLDGVTVRWGNASGQNENALGGGMHIDGGSPTLRSVRFEHNNATLGGGLFNHGGGHPVLVDVSFEDCTAGRGGAIHHTTAAMTLTDVFIKDCRSVYGGGIYMTEHNGFDADGLRIVRCDANEEGGALFVGRHSPNTNIKRFALTRNQAKRGAAIYNESTQLALSDGTIAINASRDSGGGLYNFMASPTVSGTVFDRNVAPNLGGGILNLRESNPKVWNCVFTDNQASVGGGVVNLASHPGIASCTFVRNWATTSGGALGNVDSGPGIINSIFYNNTAPTSDEILNVNSDPVFWHCLIAGSGGSNVWNYNIGTDAGGNIDADPRFVNTNERDLSLRPASPAIDAGTNLSPILPETDITGAPRIMSGVVDMGAFEFSPPVPVTLASFAVSRRGRDVRVTWSVSGLAVDYARFEVYRGESDGRERVTASTLSGCRAYVFVDINAPTEQTAYWLEETDRDGARYWHGPLRAPAAATTPTSLGVHPNPFNPSTTVRYSVSDKAVVTLAVFDAAGRRVDTILDREHRGPESYAVTYRPNLPSGVYFLRMQAGAETRVQKIVIVK